MDSTEFQNENVDNINFNITNAALNIKIACYDRKRYTDMLYQQEVNLHKVQYGYESFAKGY